VIYLLNLLREPKNAKTATDKGKIILYRIKKVIDGAFPEMINDFNDLTDKRKRHEYSMAEIICGALFISIFKEKSRNAYNNDRRDKNFRKNFYKYFKFNLPHADATDDVLRRLAPKELEDLKARLVAGLIEQKIFSKFRFLGKYYLVTVDGSGISSFDQRHCEHCLTKESKSGVVTYFHYVLEAKIVTSNGLAISIASEFIENQPDRDYEKQDCEQKGFVRLAKKIKNYFPRLPICILADGLYPNNTVFSICKKNNWSFIITLKDKNLKSFQKEVEVLKTKALKQSVNYPEKDGTTTVDYKHLNEVGYSGQNYSWIESVETTVKTDANNKPKQKRFVYISDIPQTEKDVVETATSGRLRWKIENEGFNTQKNHGYHLEHKFSRKSYTAMQNYYNLMQIGHMINQLVERSPDFIEIKKEHSKETVVNLWKMLIGYIMFNPAHENTATSLQPSS